ncbi:hypothetical protein AcV7_003904 [Taiwanofungus camphoratus]|nr:hypothetical protein AcV7_003904 [Antrodia cinnamomea]
MTRRAPNITRDHRSKKDLIRELPLALYTYRNDIATSDEHQSNDKPAAGKLQNTTPPTPVIVSIPDHGAEDNFGIVAAGAPQFVDHVIDMECGMEFSHQKRMFPVERYEPPKLVNSVDEFEKVLVDVRTIGVKDGRGPARRYRCEQHRNKDNRVMGVLCDWDLTMITQKFEDDGNTPQCLSRLHSQVEVSSRERLRDRSPGEGRRDQVASPQAPARSPPWSLTCGLAAGAPLRARPESVFAWVSVVLDLLRHTFGHLAVWEQD